MESSQYDIAIIGGGILGLSTAMQLLERVPQWRVAVIEKEEQLATHQTGHNSGVMHSGIYYRPGSHKAQFCVAGLNNMVKFCEENEIEYRQCGKVIVALHESEFGRLDDLYQRGTANGVPDLEMVGPERLKEIEPHTAGVRALWAPHTGIVDFTKVAAAFANKFQQAGGDIFTRAAVKKIANSSGSVALETTKGTLQAKHLINCAGLYADKVAAMTGEKVGVRIIPFRGEYYTLKPESHHLVSGLIYPVPDPQFPFLGVHFTRNIKGHVEAGPNAVMALRREGYRKRDFSLGDSLGNLAYPGFWKMAMKYWKIGLGEVYRSYNRRVFLHDLQRLIPEIQNSDLDSGGSGVRAQAVARDGSLLDDFSIIQGRDAIHVLNAPSPGATSSLAIGEHIAGLAIDNFGAAA
ncbi:MAG: L-2-hydroxyglutarate oxidase [Chloroflexi bacterium]|jgi:L-2-hydroxyglutarate oxidase LhgO|nr:L-2-hydroxyglutarate oxidase [Chloroflexota bacterium]MDP6498029.1 L-2-hydroxyglutarate oxidase [Dehalococcoidia bacterium]MQG10798.1 L-2-hydroxyglutarate oxidase [SAR202 cluster bacterium]MQG53723.1 L-2-hydroxyglutarate oxidase [SAR202 cluster bacterium]|tara:strand:- start:36558 stop:37775 length:1218 start_codon:yes stop_codon:yes gene_type:complete